MTALEHDRVQEFRLWSELLERMETRVDALEAQLDGFNGRDPIETGAEWDEDWDEMEMPSSLPEELLPRAQALHMRHRTVYDRMTAQQEDVVMELGRLRLSPRIPTTRYGYAPAGGSATLDING